MGTKNAIINFLKNKKCLLYKKLKYLKNLYTLLHIGKLDTWKMSEVLPDKNKKSNFHLKVEFILNEIIQSEKKYVKTLSTIVKKLVAPAAERTELFSSRDITALFGNIAELNQLHSDFYDDLSLCPMGDIHTLLRIIETHFPSMSMAYTNYCSNFPEATSFYNGLLKKQHSSALAKTASISSINQIWDNEDDNGYRRL